MLQLTKQDLIDSQKKVLEGYTKAQDDCPYDLQRTLQEIVNVQKRILHNLGYRDKALNIKKAPPKGLFNREDSKSGLPIDKEDVGIKNEAPKNGLFDNKSVAETLENDSIGIKNEAPKKGLFEEKEVVKVTEEKASPRRLSQKQIKDIKAAAADGFNIKQISDKLMIVESKVSNTLRSNGKKGGGNLLATNAKSSSEKFQDEIKESKN